MENERILLVVPCYNDVARLSEFLPELARGLSANFRVVVSDDGSEIQGEGGLAEVGRRCAGNENGWMHRGGSFY